MWHYKILLTLLGLFVFCMDAAVSQEPYKSYTDYFNFLTKDGGQWSAENPNYEEAQENDFVSFALQFERADEFGISGEVLGVRNNADTIKFWSFTEFYAPDKKKNIFFQRSANGKVYAIGEATMINDERLCEMSFYNESGLYLKHKDIHQKINDNELMSKSYDFDDKTEEWIGGNTLKWYRKIK